MCAWSTPRSTPCSWRSANPTGRSSSSRSASRPPRRPTRWPCWQAKQLGLTELLDPLCSHVLVPPAMEAVLSAPDNQVRGVPGGGARLHGHGLRGVRADRREVPRADRRHRFRAARPAAGDPHDVVAALEEGRWGREPVLALRAARGQRRGASDHRRGLRGVRPAVARHRGTIPGSGCGCGNRSWTGFDAERRFDVGDDRPPTESPLCIAGEILQGLKKPHECSQFGNACTPEHPARRADGLLRGRLRRVLPLREKEVNRAPGPTTREMGPPDLATHRLHDHVLCATAAAGG